MPTGPSTLSTGDQVIAQATQEAALTKMVTHGETLGAMAYTRTVQLGDVGGEVLELAGHAWSGGSVKWLLHRPPRTRRQPGDDPLLPGACERKGGDQALMHESRPRQWRKSKRRGRLSDPT
jgi:hypothetical protein